MAILTDAEIKEWLNLTNGTSFDGKVKIIKQNKSYLIDVFKQAQLKKNPNIDKSYLRESATMAISTMIAHSAGANGYSKKEYDFINAVFSDSDDYDIRYHMLLGNYDSFCEIVDSHRGKFWTEEFLKLTKYLSYDAKKTIAAFMFVFASADGGVADAEKNSIVNFINKFN